jgi:hypothetical protein
MNSPTEHKQKKPVHFVSIWFWLMKLPGNLRKAYNRAGYRITYEVRPNEFNFINGWVFLMIALPTALFYFLVYRGKVSLNLLTLPTQIYIAENVLRVVCLFISIVFSFIVLSLNFFHKYFGRLAFTTFLTNKYVKFLFSLFISDVILLLYTSGFLKEGVVRTTYGDALFILSNIVSLVLILSIIPVFILLLRSAQNRDNIRQLIAKFNTKWYAGYRLNPILNNGVNRLEEREPINLLIEIGTAAIKDFDRASLMAIRSECVEHIKKLYMAHKSDERSVHPFYFYDRVITMCRSLYQIAVKERNETAGLMILHLHYDIEAYYLQHFDDFSVHGHSNQHYDGIGFNIAMEQAFIKALQFNEDVLAEEVISLCRDWFALYVKEHLVKINYDHKFEPYETSPVKSDISFIYFSLERMFLNALTYKKSFLYKHIVTFYVTIGISIVESKNTRNTKVGLLQYHGWSNLEMFKKFVKAIDTEVISEIYPFGIYTTLELTHVKSQIPIQYELRAFDFLFKENKLNAYVINSIKAVALHLIPLLKEDKSYIVLFSTLIKKFDTIRGYVAAGSTDKQKEVYILLEKYLGWMKEWLVEEGGNEAAELLKEINFALKKFKLKDSFNRELNAKGYFVIDHLRS